MNMFMYIHVVDMYIYICIYCCISVNTLHMVLQEGVIVLGKSDILIHSYLYIHVTCIYLCICM